MDWRSQAAWAFFGAMGEVRAAVDAGGMSAREAVARLRVNLDRAAGDCAARRARGEKASGKGGQRHGEA